MPRIARLGDYKGGGGGGGGAGGGDSGSDEDGQPAFIGNGQNVIGPPKAKTVDDVFKQKGVDGAGGKKQSCKIVFWKSGYTINFNEPGGESDLFPYETPEGKVRQFSLRTVRSRTRSPHPARMHHHHDTPVCQAFVEQVAMGRLPKQLEEMMKAKGLTDGRRAVELDIAVEDKRQGTDDYVKPPYRAFSGAAASVGQAAPPPAAAVFKAATGAGAASAIVDPSAPKTSVQVKLVDGKRIIVELNLTHKVSDLVARVAAAAATGGKPFTLMTGFPPKALDNPGLTIEEAGLKNASVQQHA